MEQIESHCSWCKRSKPVSAFSRLRNNDGTYRPHSHCKACRNDRAKLRLLQGVRKDRPKPGMMGETNPGAWKWPRDERPMSDKLLDYELRAWPALGQVVGIMSPSVGLVMGVAG